MSNYQYRRNIRLTNQKQLDIPAVVPTGADKVAIIRRKPDVGHMGWMPDKLFIWRLKHTEYNDHYKSI